MNDDLQSIDLDWAWSPYEPAPSGTGWTRRHAAHLYRRAGFAASDAELQRALSMSPVELVREMVDTPATGLDDGSAALARAGIATGQTKNLSAWWVHRLLTTPEQLTEKMTLFWHGHFATGAEKVEDVRLMFAQNELFREHALGDFGDLLHKVSRDPAMLIYLDSVSNRKAHPNENYAREIMELFCLGEGAYTEQDIRELARCFTGWEVRNERFRFNRYQHDSGSKTILGESGEFSGDDGVDVVLKQPAGPMFLVGKLMRYFMFDEPSPPASLVEPLARQLRDDDLQVGPTIERMLSSNLFYSAHCVARKVKSPVESAVGLLRVLEGSTDTYQLAAELGNCGQNLFFPPNVKGWDGGRTWINSSTLLSRANLIHDLLNRSETRFAGGNLEAFCEQHDLRTSIEIVTWLEQMLLAMPLAPETQAQVAARIDDGQGSRNERLRDAIHVFCTLPEFQIG